MAATINKDMIIADMLKIDPGIAAILMALGMHCIGCPSAQGETLDEAAMVHGMNADELVVNVNEYLAKKEA
ncbi:hydroxylamine reductase [Clostridium sp. CAG:75]|nr:hydroxylamine reductase [Clostridium sp. CAG:75]